MQEKELEFHHEIKGETSKDSVRGQHNQTDGFGKSFW